MKRTKNIFEPIIAVENLANAADKAMRGKGSRAITAFVSKKAERLTELHDSLKSGTYIPSAYKELIILDPKRRVIKIAPFYPDRIVHHAVMNVLEPVISNVLIHHTYACIKGKGGHRCIADLYADMRSNYDDTTYCLKFDIRKFYDSVDHEILKKIIRRKLADDKALALIDLIIDSTEAGIPIGNYTSQHFSNLYLAYFDHYCKEELGLKYYYRYMDDIVVLAASKAELQRTFNNIESYLNQRLKLEIKGNWQIFPVDKRQIDFCGYRVNHHGVMLRKKILYNLFKKYGGIIDTAKISDINMLKNSLPSHYGWLLHTSKRHFTQITNHLISHKNAKT